MKRIFVFCLAAVMVLSLAACGSKPSNGSASVETKETEPKKTEAQVALEDGINYWFGINGVTYDKEKAREAFQKAADGGEAEGYYWLGDIRCYEEGADRKTEVIELFQKALDQGAFYGAYGLGELYEAGWGVELDYAKAAEYYQQALDGGCLMGAVGLGGLYAKGNGVAADGGKAMEYYQTALKSEDFNTLHRAEYGIGKLYQDGIGVAQDAAIAFEWYTKAAEAGHLSGIFGVANAYEHGTGVPQDGAKVIEWYQKEEAHGSWYNQAICYEYGGGQYGVEPDHQKALELFHKEIVEGKKVGDAMTGIGYMTFYGMGVEANPQEADAWFHRALDAARPWDTDTVQLATEWIAYIENGGT